MQSAKKVVIVVEVVRCQIARPYPCHGIVDHYELRMQHSSMIDRDPAERTHAQDAKSDILNTQLLPEGAIFVASELIFVHEDPDLHSARRGLAQCGNQIGPIAHFAIARRSGHPPGGNGNTLSRLRDVFEQRMPD